MRKNDIIAKVDLSEFDKTEHFYGLGAIENLNGEIQIFDSKPYNSFVEDGKLKFDTTYAKKATLFVYAIVEHWKSIPIPNKVTTKKQLEQFLEKTAKENNVDTRQAFPFLIEGITKELHWHVINWKEGDTKHSHEKHITSGLYGTESDKQVEILGFYSNAHHAIFTHHTTNMHMHAILKNGKIAGHVDDLKLGAKMTLKLPIN